MRIAQLAPLVESVPPRAYGGTELVVSLLTEELLKRGHEVTLFASGDSRTNARLIDTVSKPLRQSQDIFRHRWSAYETKSILKALSMQNEFDIVHNHMGYVALPFLKEFNVPVVTTMHNNISSYCADIYFEYGKFPFIAISEAYKQLNFPDKINYVDVVYNGIDLGDFELKNEISRDYLLFIGRISKAKGTACAIDIAIELNLPLKIAGKVDAADMPYFESEVKHKLGHPLIEYIGEITLEQKAELYGGARAVVYPIDFDEPFGLVMSEALASGTPVMAFDRGSVREIIIDGKTGIVGNTKEDLILRFSQIAKIGSENCKERAKKYFSKEHMVVEYEKVFNRLVSKSGIERVYQYTV